MHRYAFVVLLPLLLQTGCTSARFGQSQNPFHAFTADDVSRISLCSEDTIYGPDRSDDEDQGTFDAACPVEFYLRPAGAAVRDRETIQKLYDALAETQFAPTNGAPWCGILGYQVFFGKNNEILAATHIVNFRATVVPTQCRLREGRIQLPINLGYPETPGQSPLFCRIILDFMKNHLPKEVSDQDLFYKAILMRSGGLEGQLFSEE